MFGEQEFLQYASDCHVIAGATSNVSHREALRRMERAWRRLADEEGRIAELAHAVDRLFSDADAARALSGGPPSDRQARATAIMR